MTTPCGSCHRSDFVSFLVDRPAKWCFRCESCKTKLSAGTGNYRITNGKNFCQICYDKLFNLAKKQKYAVFGMSEEEQSKLVKSATKESALSWQRQSAPSLVSGWADAAQPASGKHGRGTERRSSMESFNGFNSPSGSRTASPVPERMDDADDFGFGSDGGDEPAGPFDNAAQVDGVEIWRVEGKNVVQKYNEPMADRPAANVGVDAHRGTLYNGDVYVILSNSVSPRFCALLKTVSHHACHCRSGRGRYPPS